MKKLVNGIALFGDEARPFLAYTVSIPPLMGLIGAYVAFGCGPDAPEGMFLLSGCLAIIPTLWLAGYMFFPDTRKKHCRADVVAMAMLTLLATAGWVTPVLFSEATNGTSYEAILVVDESAGTMELISSPQAGGEWCWAGKRCVVVPAKKAKRNLYEYSRNPHPRRYMIIQEKNSEESGAITQLSIAPVE